MEPAERALEGNVHPHIWPQGLCWMCVGCWVVTGSVNMSGHQLYLERWLCPPTERRKRIRAWFDWQKPNLDFLRTLLFCALSRMSCQPRLLGVITSFLRCTFSPSVVPEPSCYWQWFPVSGQHLFWRNVLNKRLHTMCFCILIYDMISMMKDDWWWAKHQKVWRHPIVILPFLLSVSLAVHRILLKFGTLVEGQRNFLTKFGPSAANSVVPPLGQIWA